MFKKSEQNPPVPFLHKLITLGMLLFFVYFYFTDFQTKQAEKELLTKKVMADKIKVSNLVTGDILLLDPKEPKKIVISLNKITLQQKMKQTKGDNIDILEITVPSANLTKP